MRIALLGLVGVAVLSGCATRKEVSDVVAPATEVQTQDLLGRMKSLEGEWTMKDETGATVTASVFKATSGGSAVREIMFPGTAHEMTNMYHMDGPSMVVTHYCAAGNQPRMRTTGASGNTLHFTYAGVTNKTAKDQTCMGDLVIEFKDADHIVQHWNTIGSGKDHTAVFELTRKR